jgi:predicted O-methyltransferase YrrM
VLKNTLRALADAGGNAHVTAWRRRRWLTREARRLRHALLRRPPLDAVIDLVLANDTFRPEQKRSEIRSLLLELVDPRPRHVLEIGGRRGGTLILFAHVAAPDARLLSVDIAYDVARVEAVEGMAAEMQRIHAWQADSHAEATRDAVREWLDGAMLDFLFIDGDHSYNGVSRDFEMYSPFVREGGIVAFHDIVPDARSRDGVASAADSGQVPTFWRQIRSRGFASHEIVDDPDQDGFGIGVLRAPAVANAR